MINPILPIFGPMGICMILQFYQQTIKDGSIDLPKNKFCELGMFLYLWSIN